MSSYLLPRSTSCILANTPRCAIPDLKAHDDPVPILAECGAIRRAWPPTLLATRRAVSASATSGSQTPLFSNVPYPPVSAFIAGLPVFVVPAVRVSIFREISRARTGMLQRWSAGSPFRTDSPAFGICRHFLPSSRLPATFLFLLPTV